MWSLTDDGFLSIVEFDPPNVTIKYAVYGKKEDGKTDYTNIIEPAEKGTDKVCQEQIDQLVGYVAKADSVDGRSSHLLVRARVEEDMAPLASYDPNAVFFSDLTADYQFRCIISRVALAMYEFNKVMGIDYYSHVKETVNRRAPQIQGGRMTALSTVWSAFSKWQPNAPYGAVSGSMYGHSYGSGTTNLEKTKKDWASTSGSSAYTSGTKYGSYNRTRDGDFTSWWDKNRAAEKDEDSRLDALTDDEWENATEHSAFRDDVWRDDTEWVDDPSVDMSELDMRVASGDISEETMRLQLKEILTADKMIDLISLDQAVEAITDSFGTCDVASIADHELYAILDALPEVNDLDSVKETHDSNV